MIEKFWNWFDPLEWYWKVLLILIFWWLFIPLYIWTKTELEKPVKWAITFIIAFLFLSSFASADNKTQNQNSSANDSYSSSQATLNKVDALTEDINEIKEAIESIKKDKGLTLESQTESAEQAPQNELAKVIRVIDGDTIEVQFDNGSTVKIRYIGIDTWEIGDAPHGGHGTETNKKLVEGEQVKLIKDVSESDKYDRLLRYVYVGNIFVNAQLLKMVMQKLRITRRIVNMHRNLKSFKSKLKAQK